MSNQKLKFSRGLEGQLPSTYNDGEVRFCTDTGSLFIDSGNGRVKIAAGKADTADKLTTARAITLAGDVTGSVSFDGSKAITITTTVKDDSHNHIIDNIDGLQAALDDKITDVVTLNENDDLNTFKISGLFSAFSSVISNTILNKPSGLDDTGLVLQVYALGTDYVLQVVYGTNGGSIYKRRYSHSSWSEWVTVICSNNIASQSVASAMKDSSGNIITSTYETKVDASAKLTEAKTYTDNAVAQKSQVQILTWGDDD